MTQLSQSEQSRHLINTITLHCIALHYIRILFIVAYIKKQGPLWRITKRLNRSSSFLTQRLQSAYPTLCCSAVAYSPGGQGDVSSPRFQADGTVMQKSSHFLTHNDAIAGFTSQSLGLPAYACKTESSNAIKLAPRTHQNLPFELKKRKNIHRYKV